MGSWVGPAVTATLISSIIAMIGWVVTWKTTRRLEIERRRERVVDVQTALLAEIRATAHALGQYDKTVILSKIRKRLQNTKATPYVPFVTREAGTPVFRAIIGELSVLPTEVIDPIVLFYNQHQVIEFFAEDLRGNRFADLPNPQKIEMLEDYLNLQAHACKLAMDAMSALKLSLGINTPGEDLSDPQLASD